MAAAIKIIITRTFLLLSNLNIGVIGLWFYSNQDICQYNDLFYMLDYLMVLLFLVLRTAMSVYILQKVQRNKLLANLVPYMKKIPF